MSKVTSTFLLGHMLQDIGWKAVGCLHSYKTLNKSHVASVRACLKWELSQAMGQLLVHAVTSFLQCPCAEACYLCTLSAERRVGVFWDSRAFQLTCTVAGLFIFQGYLGRKDFQKFQYVRSNGIIRGSNPLMLDRKSFKFEVLLEVPWECSCC